MAGDMGFVLLVPLYSRVGALGHPPDKGHVVLMSYLDCNVKACVSSRVRAGLG